MNRFFDDINVEDYLIFTYGTDDYIEDDYLHGCPMAHPDQDFDILDEIEDDTLPF